MVWFIVLTEISNGDDEMRNLRMVLLLVLVAILSVSATGFAEVDKDISVAFVGINESGRPAEYEVLLKEYFNNVKLIDYADFSAEAVADFDVVAIDFSWNYRALMKKHPKPVLPEGWDKPTILISSGDMIKGRNVAAKINWL